MTASERHALAELARLRKVIADPAAHPFEIESAQKALDKLIAPPVCQFCDRLISMHSEGQDRNAAGSSLCPIVRDHGKADGPHGAKLGMRYYSAPTREQIAAWKASNVPAPPKKLTRVERAADMNERQGKL